MGRALQIHPRDNVAVVLSDIHEGEEILVNREGGGLTVCAARAIPFGHKVALQEFLVDEPIFKYGEEIGKARTLIPVGDWVHLDNVYCERGREE